MIGLKSDKCVWFVVLTTICLSALLLIYKIHINTDMLFMEYLFQDIFQEQGAWRYWKLSPAPSYFPDMMLYAIAFFMLKTVPLRIFFVTLMQIIMLSFLGDWLVRKINSSSTILTRGIVQFFLLIAVIATNHTATSIQPMLSIGIFYIADNTQVPTVISSLLLLGLYIGFFNRQTWLLGLCLVLVGALAQASSPVFIICFAIPFAMTLSSLILLAVKRNDTFLLRVTLVALSVLIVSQIMGYIFSESFTFNSPIGRRIELSMDRFMNALHLFKAAALNIYDPSNVFSFLSALVCTAAFVYAGFNSINVVFSSFQMSRDSSVKVLLVCLFFLFSTFTSLSGSMISGGFVDIYGYRYFMTFSAVSFVLTGVFIGQNMSDTRSRQAICLLILLMICGAALSAWKVMAIPGKRTLAEIAKWGAYPRAEQEIAKCISQLSASKEKIYSGLGDFWSTRAVMFYLNNEVYIQPTLNNLQPLFLTSSAESLIDPAKYGIQKYNFVILRNENKPNQFTYDMSGMRAILPKGYVVTDCVAGDAKILVYKNNELDETVRPLFKSFFIETFGKSEYNR